MKRTRAFIGEERGAVLVQVGIAVLVLMAFNVFVIDYGMMWNARIQAQNAADAGALAGAIARAYDDRANPPHPDGLAGDITRRVARANLIWQQPGEPIVSFECPAGVTARCTRVDVHRDGNNGSTALPSFFGPILGINSQQVRATATSVTLSGNATPCLSPIAFPDDWDNNLDPPGEFNRYVESGSGAGTLLPAPRDDYQAPTATYAGRTTVSLDYGERIVWTIDHPLGEPITRGLMVPLTLPGGRTFEQNMATCVGQPTSIGQRIPMVELHPSTVEDAIVDVFNRDPAADYDYGDSRIIGSCAPACAPLSPRLLVIALFDPGRFQLGRATNDWTQPAVGCASNNPCITVTNIIGFFVHRLAGGSFGAHGHFLRYPGISVETAPTLVDDGSWLVATHLIR